MCWKIAKLCNDAIISLILLDSKEESAADIVGRVRILRITHHEYNCIYQCLYSFSWFLLMISAGCVHKQNNAPYC